MFLCYTSAKTSAPDSDPEIELRAEPESFPAVGVVDMNRMAVSSRVRRSDCCSGSVLSALRLNRKREMSADVRLWRSTPDVSKERKRN